METNVGGLKGDKEAVYVKQELVSNVHKAIIYQSLLWAV